MSNQQSVWRQMMKEMVIQQVMSPWLSRVHVAMHALSPESPGELVDDGHVVGDGLVVHGPASADELEAAALHQLLDLVAARVVLVLPPLPEERRLHVDEPEWACATWLVIAIKI